MNPINQSISKTNYITQLQDKTTKHQTSIKFSSLNTTVLFLHYHTLAYYISISIMSNLYGFDFLKSDHKLHESNDQNNTNQQGQEQPSQPIIPTSSSSYPSSYIQKSDLEKQHDVIKFLKSHRSSCLSPAIIYSHLQIDISEGGDDSTVRQMLLNNKQIKVEEEPDPENPSLTIYTFGYQAKYNNVRNKIGLLAQINKSKYGIKRHDLLDSYEGVEQDIGALISAGEIIAIPNSEQKDNPVLIQRGETFFVELDGHVASMSMGSSGGGGGVGSSAAANTTLTTMSTMSTMTNTTDTEKKCENDHYNPFLIETDGDPKKQIRRGEAVWIGGQWFRVSSAVKEGVPLSEQPPRAQPPLSATSYKDLSKKNDADGYVRPFNSKIIPLDHPLLPETIDNIQKGREALTKLHKIASSTGGRSVTGGASAQLLSSNATSDNFETLVDKFAFTATGAGQGSLSNSSRRRPAIHGNRSQLLNSHFAHRKKGVSTKIEEASKASKDPSLIYCHPRRHGCTMDVRQLYLATRNKIPEPEREVEIFNMMVQYKLLDKNSKMKRPRMSEENKNLDKDGRPMKRRYYVKKSDQLRNEHLKNTAIGELLQAALDKQQQGKAVGDGGM
jgi:hypothetical protein